MPGCQNLLEPLNSAAQIITRKSEGQLDESVKKTSAYYVRI